jgi:type I restriction enzyme M protein
MPVLGVIFLRHATNRYHEALKRDSGRPGRRQDAQAPAHRKADFKKRRALLLPPAARYDDLLKRCPKAPTSAPPSSTP